MKTKTKALVTALCAVLLVVVSVLGTMAYLTSETKVVKNTFTVGEVSIKLDEAVVDENGKATDARTEEGNAYKILPGLQYDKDPTVTVLKGSEDCYVRMFVRFNKSDVLDTVFEKADLTSIFVGYDATKWTYVGNVEDATAKTRTYEFRYYKAAGGSADSNTVLEDLFTGIKLPGEDLDNDETASLSGLEIKVVAQAIQADGFNGDADAAFAALPTASFN